MKHFLLLILSLLICVSSAILCRAAQNDPNHIEIIHNKNRPRPESPETPIVVRRLSGNVISIFGKPCEFVTVGIFREGQIKPHAVAVTDSLGRFSFDDIDSCTIVKARMAGSDELIMEIRDRSEIEVGRLSSKARLLKDTTPGASDRFFCQYLEAYMPPKRVKDESADAFELLFGMAVPELLDFLSVDICHKEITTLWGLPVEVFIDRESLINKDPDQMTHASVDDLTELDPSTVKMVEYAELPDIACRYGLRRVLNIVTR